MSDLADLEWRAKTDGEAAMALAEARLFGDFGPPDRAGAYAAVKQSAKLGFEDGRRAWVYLTAAGIGHKPDEINHLVYALRKKVELDGRTPRFLETVSGLGYRLIMQPLPWLPEKDQE